MNTDAHMRFLDAGSAVTYKLHIKVLDGDVTLKSNRGSL